MGGLSYCVKEFPEGWFSIQGTDLWLKGHCPGLFSATGFLSDLVQAPWFLSKLWPKPGADAVTKKRNLLSPRVYKAGRGN